MKGILEFSLPEETEEFETAQAGWKWKVVIHDLFNHIRSKTKYCELKENQYEVYDEIRQKLADLMDEYELRD